MRAKAAGVRVSPPRYPARYRSRRAGGCVLFSVACILVPRFSLRRGGLPLAEILMDECNRHAAFADARSHPLDRAMANVADRKNTRHAGFQQIGVALERP